MANKDLSGYIKEQLEKGYDLQQIRLSLLKQGYSKSAVDNAARQARKGLPLIWTAIILTIAVIVVLSILVYVKFQTPAEQLLPEQERLQPAEQEEALPAIEDITEKEDTGLEKIPVPPAEQIPQMQEREEEITFETSMKIEEIKEISVAEPDRAEALCNDLETRAEKDNCYAQIAGASAKPEFCGKISRQAARDQCYFSFAMAGYNTCNQIKDNLTRESCSRLAELNLTAT